MPAAKPAPADPPQLDLFEHSRDTMLRNDVLDALLRRQPASAAAALQVLADDTPGHPALAPLGLLARTLAAAQADDGAPIPHHAGLAQARAQLQHNVAPAAVAQLGQAAGTAWLAPLWRALATRADALAFDAQHAEDHAAALWLLAGASADGDADGDADADAAHAVQAVQAIPSWRRIPAPLAWMAQARHRLQGLDSTWPLLAELAWLAPARLASTAQALADPLLNRLLQRFAQDLDADGAEHPLAWLPAWLLIDQPALLARLREARTGQDSAPEQAFRLLAELLGLERQARQAEVISHRKRLRETQPALFEAYLRRR